MLFYILCALFLAHALTAQHMTLDRTFFASKANDAALDNTCKDDFRLPAMCETQDGIVHSAPQLRCILRSLGYSPTAAKTIEYFRKQKEPMNFAAFLEIAKEEHNNGNELTEIIKALKGLDRCEWQLRAGIGYRYMLSFEFAEDRDGFYQRRYGGSQGGCFADLMFFNGEPKHETINYRNDRMFCDNRKTFVSDADLVTVIYTDANTRHYKGLSEDPNETSYYVPFRVNYTKVPNNYDKKGCGYLISANTTQLFGNYSSSGTDTVRYCHALLRRPSGYATTLVQISEYHEVTVLYAPDCSDWSNSVILESTIDVPRVVYERFCKVSFMNSSKPISRLYLNQDLELHIFSMQSAFMPVPRGDVFQTGRDIFRLWWNDYGTEHGRYNESQFR
ncbi:hypothetical protein GCK32_006022 [Trichostrongylus colubriformis]|uniref:Uncharacterized protein n=1 Tax=Trichostrongylus colubriformis TaxID=6319 RepID=A0AAN8EX19_TRICO